MFFQSTKPLGTGDLIHTIENENLVILSVLPISPVILKYLKKRKTLRELLQQDKTEINTVLQRTGVLEYQKMLRLYAQRIYFSVIFLQNYKDLYLLVFLYFRKLT